MAKRVVSGAVPLGVEACDAPRIVVVIPYFQRDEGLLGEALSSVLRQSVLARGAAIDILVVDDHSPRDPRLDLDDLETPPRVSLAILRTRRNGGPAAARNFALAAVPSMTNYVAYLDSDEVWAERHLENAVSGLESAPADLYFANYARAEWMRDKFSINQFGAGHEQMSADGTLFRFVGDPLVEVLIRATVRIQTCVVRWRELSALRFNEALAIGEDADYVAQAISRLSGRLCFCNQVETYEVRGGVNVSQNKDRDPLKECEIRREMLVYQLHVLREYGTGTRLRPVAEQALAEARYNSLRSCFGPGVGARSACGAFLRSSISDPGFFFWSIAFASRSLFRRIVNL